MLAVLAGCQGSSARVDPVEKGLDAFPLWEAERVTGAADRSLTDLWVRDDGAEGWAVGPDGLVVHYSGGAWRSDTSARIPDADWRSVTFNRDGTVGFMVGSGGRILQYDSATRAWRPYPDVVTSRDLFSVWLDSLGQGGYAVGAGGVMLYWTGQRWSQITPSRPFTTDLRDVASDGRDEVWVRDSTAKVTRLRRTRDGLDWIGQIPRFDASELWSQYGRFWIAGVSYPAEGQGQEPDSLYTVRWFEESRDGSINRVPVPAEAGWMHPDGQWGIIAGPDVIGTGWELLHRFVYLVSNRAFTWVAPDSAAIRAIWVNRHGTTGWAVGDNGYIARLRWVGLRVSAIHARAGSLEKPGGRYELDLDLDSGVPQPRLDSLQLVDGALVLPLSASDYSVRTGNRTIELFLTSQGAAKAAYFDGRRVRLRFTLSYTFSSSPYVVSYQTHPIPVGGGDSRSVLRWGLKFLGRALSHPLVLAALGGLAALALLVRRRRGGMFSRTFLRSKAVKLLKMLPGVARNLLFRGYNERLAEHPAVRAAAERYFGLPARDPDGKLIPPSPGGELLHQAIADALEPQQPVVVFGRGGAGKTTLLARLAHLAIEGRLPPALDGYRTLFVPAAYYSTSLTQAIADVLRERDGVEVEQATLEAQLQTGKFLVLFDGVSEVVTDPVKAMDEILATARMSDYRECRFVISSRPQETRPRDAKLFELQPLTPEVIADILVKERLGTYAANHVRLQLRSFGDRPIEPLLLTMILRQGDSGQLSATRAELYERYFQALLKVETNADAWTGWRMALEEIAFHFVLETGRRGVGLNHEVLISRLSHANGEGLVARIRRLHSLPVESERELLSRLEEAGILLRGRRWRFAHDTFEEFFAASYLVSYYDRTDRLPSLEKWTDSPEREQDFLEVIDFVGELVDPAVREALLSCLRPGWRARLENGGGPSRDPGPVSAPSAGGG